MFSLFNGLYEELTYVRERQVLLLGVENSGKSCILEWLKQINSSSSSSQSTPAASASSDVHSNNTNGTTTKPPPSLRRVIPTVGLNVAKLKVNGEKLLVWDLGGVKSLRSIWERYINEAEILIWVIDSSDPSKFDDSKQTLKQLLKHEHLKQMPLLVYANKQDLSNAIDPVKVSLTLDLLMEAEIRPQCIQPCSTQTGQGIQQGFEWLLSCLKGDSKPGMRIP